MTEAEWKSCTDPTLMLEFLRPRERATQRQLRLFSLACCYRLLHLLPPEGRRLLDVSDQFGEGTAARHERDAAVAAFRRIHGRFGSDKPLLRAVYHSKDIAFDVWTASLVAGNAALAAGGRAEDEKRAQAELLRDIYGPLPFRSVTLLRDVLAWNDRLVVRLAQAIYDERRWGEMPILADALLDAGADNEELLAHVRFGETHVRGCWALDTVLGKN
jgi:hypothetical protein